MGATGFLEPISAWGSCEGTGIVATRSDILPKSRVTDIINVSQPLPGIRTSDLMRSPGSCPATMLFVGLLSSEQRVALYISPPNVYCTD